MSAEQELAKIEGLLRLIVAERVGKQSWLFEDALQEARIRAWERLRDGHSRKLATYAARQAVIDVVRGGRMTGSKEAGKAVGAHRRAVSFEGPADSGGETHVIEPEDVTAAEELDRIIARDDLRPLLAALSPRDREIVAAYYLVGLTQAEIAERYGLTRQGVSYRLDRALSKMCSAGSQVP